MNKEPMIKNDMLTLIPQSVCQLSSNYHTLTTTIINTQADFVKSGKAHPVYMLIVYGLVLSPFIILSTAAAVRIVNQSTKNEN